MYHFFPHGVCQITNIFIIQRKIVLTTQFMDSMTKGKSFCLLSTSQLVKRMPHTLLDHVPFFSTWRMSDYKHFHHSEEDCTYHAVHGQYDKRQVFLFAEHISVSEENATYFTRSCTIFFHMAYVRLQTFSSFRGRLYLPRSSWTLLAQFLSASYFNISW